MNTYNNEFANREGEIRATLVLNECIHKITDIYHSRYDPTTPSFDAWDQLLACEAVAGSSLIQEKKQKQIQDIKENVNVNEMINDGCKHTVYFELTQSKQNVITAITSCNYRTPPIHIASLLSELFVEWPSHSNHWLFIAQRYNPRAIWRTINQMVKAHRNGQVTIENPPAYFTSLIKKSRKQRRGI